MVGCLCQQCLQDTELKGQPHFCSQAGIDGLRHMQRVLEAPAAGDWVQVKSKVSSLNQIFIIGRQHNVACVPLKRLQPWHVRFRKAAGEAVTARQLQLVHNVPRSWLTRSLNDS